MTAPRSDPGVPQPEANSERGAGRPHVVRGLDRCWCLAWHGEDPAITAARIAAHGFVILRPER